MLSLALAAALMAAEPNCFCPIKATVGFRVIETGSSWDSGCFGREPNTIYLDANSVSLYCPSTDEDECNTWSDAHDGNGPWQNNTCCNQAFGCWRYRSMCGSVAVIDPVTNDLRYLYILMPGAESELDSNWWTWEPDEVKTDIDIRLFQTSGCGDCEPEECVQCPPAAPVTYWKPAHGTTGAGGFRLLGDYANSCDFTLGYPYDEELVEDCDCGGGG